MAHHSLRNHHKLKALADALRITPAHATGLLQFFWWSVYSRSDVHPTGLVPTSWNDVVIAHNAGWTGKPPDALTKALIAAGFLERAANGNLSVHDLYEWAPDYVRRRWRRQGWSRTDEGGWLRLAPTSTSHDHTMSGQRADMTSHDRTCLANDTRPDPTRRNETNPGPVDSLAPVRAAGNPRQTRAGPEDLSGNFTGSDRAMRAQRDKFRSLFAAKVCIALGLNSVGATQQRRSLYAVARRIEGRADCEALATRLIAIATEKRDAGLDKPIAAWQKAANEVLGR